MRRRRVFDVFWQLAIQENASEDKLARVYSFDLVGSVLVSLGSREVRRLERVLA